MSGSTVGRRARHRARPAASSARRGGRCAPKRLRAARRGRSRACRARRPRAAARPPRPPQLARHLVDAQPPSSRRRSRGPAGCSPRRRARRRGRRARAKRGPPQVARSQGSAHRRPPRAARRARPCPAAGSTPTARPPRSTYRSAGWGRSSRSGSRSRAPRCRAAGRRSGRRRSPPRETTGPRRRGRSMSRRSLAAPYRARGARHRRAPPAAPRPRAQAARRPRPGPSRCRRSARVSRDHCLPRSYDAHRSDAQGSLRRRRSGVPSSTTMATGSTGSTIPLGLAAVSPGPPRSRRR